MESQIVTWEEARARLKEEFGRINLRQRTIDDYMMILDVLQHVFPRSIGPGDITDKSAEEFVSRRKAENLSPFTLVGNLKKLYTIWKKWFAGKLEIVGSNPWAEIELPKVEKHHKRILSHLEEAEFYAWLEVKFSGWRLPRLWFRVKSLIGTRSLDLCSVQSCWLHNNGIVFPAEVMKARKDRRCILPAVLFEELKEIAGPTYLWEGYVDGLKKCFSDRGGRYKRYATNLKPFTPKRLVGWTQDLCNEYCLEMRKKNPAFRPFTPHNFRGTAMQRALKVTGGDLIGTSVTMHCHPDTIRAYYADLEEQEISDTIMEKMQKDAGYEAG
jgi:integrase